jgi:hypothetical protein
MRRFFLVLLALACASLAQAHPGGLDANGGHTNSKTGEYHYHRAEPAPAAATPVLVEKKTVRPLGSIPRDSRGRIDRSFAMRQLFMRSNPCPSTGQDHGACPGYVVDHVVPLYKGGPDVPLNMQWQTIAEGKAKDRWE